MNKKVSVTGTLVFAYLMSANFALSQSAKNYRDVTPDEMTTAFEVTQKDIQQDNQSSTGINMNLRLHPYKWGPNYNDRRGCIVNLCPSLVTIDHFNFGNTLTTVVSAGNVTSQYAYVWATHKPSIISFSISTIEFDPFGNQLPSSTWVIPIDDNGISRKYNPQGTEATYLGDGSPNNRVNISNFDRNGFENGVQYTSIFAGKATSAEVLTHLSDALNIIPKDILGKFTPDFLSRRIPELHAEPEVPEIPGIGRSTRFTVVTFVSSVRYKGADGQGHHWSIPPAIWGFADCYEKGLKGSAETVFNLTNPGP